MKRTTIIGLIAVILVLGITATAVMASAHTEDQQDGVSIRKSVEGPNHPGGLPPGGRPTMAVAPGSTAKGGSSTSTPVPVIKLVAPATLKLIKPKAGTTLVAAATPAATPVPTVTPTPTPQGPTQVITFTSTQFLVGKPIDPYEKCLNSAKFYKLQTGKDYPVDCSQYKTTSGGSSSSGGTTQSGTTVATGSLGVKTGGTTFTTGATTVSGGSGTSTSLGTSLVSTSLFKSGGLGIQSGSMMGGAGTYSGSTSFTSMM